jgi:hypothetical protein
VSRIRWKSRKPPLGAVTYVRASCDADSKSDRA